MDPALIRSFGRRVRLAWSAAARLIIGGTHLWRWTDGYCNWRLARCLAAGLCNEAQSQMIDRERAYTDWRVMLEREAQRSDRIDAVVIATPPQLHFPIAKAFLERGIDVICEKPMTRDFAEAQELVRIVRENNRIFSVTHFYSGFPMTRQARALIKQVAIGGVRMIVVIFSPGDPGTSVEPENPRTGTGASRPRRSGKLQSLARSILTPTTWLASSAGWKGNAYPHTCPRS
jgi:predicted dehydrogenase